MTRIQSVAGTHRDRGRTIKTGRQTDKGETGRETRRPAAARGTGRVIVLRDGRNPSTDIYLRPRLAGPGMAPAEFLDIARDRPADRDLGPAGDGSGAFVIVCRYISGDWLAALERARPGLAGVALFMDDDLPAMLRDPSLPLRYRLRIWLRYGRFAARLSARADSLWVATPELARRYRGAELLPPLYVLGPSGAAAPVRYFYHGTAAHGPEIGWLRDIVAETQRRDPRLLFEISGGPAVRRRFRGIERVTVVHPMPWPTYLAYTAAAPQAIGLAPLLPSAVNGARSHSRFYDIARTGAAGLYSDRAPYAGFVRDGEDGLLLPDDPAAWVEAILDLAADEPRRRAMARAARARCAQTDEALARLMGLERDGPAPAMVEAASA